ncbi:MAG TPA: hypothetical protein VNL92_06250 [Dehalococcoidia bacterium]|nr:hypothetical protein [Dehalococcoidia bacterium]
MAAIPEWFDEALMDEASEWISVMLEEEEGAFIDSGLVFQILEREWLMRDDQAAPIPHAEMASMLSERLEADGIRGVPDEISVGLIIGVLTWEDEFLALAGRPRTL